MATTPQFATTPARAKATVSTANTARDGSGTLATVVTAGANGTRVSAVRVVATGTTTDGMVRLFLHDGTTAHLWDEISVSSATPSATVAVFQAERVVQLLLPTGWSLRASTHNAETFVVHAEASNL